MKRSAEKEVALYKAVAVHYGRDMDIKQLSRYTGVDRKVLTAIAYKLRKSGIDVPVFKNPKGLMTQVVEELQQEHPELLKKEARKAESSGDRISRILAGAKN